MRAHSVQSRTVKQGLGLTASLGLFLTACAVNAASETYSGYYRQGFEQSVFYTDDGEGPYWLDGTEAVFGELQEYLIRKNGRGSYIAVRMSVAGDLTSDGGYGHIGRYTSRLYVTEILSIEPISSEEFEQQVAKFRAAETAGQ